MAGSHRIGEKPWETIVVEPRVGGRWYECNTAGEQGNWGTVLAWNPPHGVAFSWHMGPGHDQHDWQYDPDPARASQVDVTFKAEGPNATLVELVHSKLERHGDGYVQLRALFDSPGAWSAILTSYADCLKRTELQ